MFLVFFKTQAGTPGLQLKLSLGNKTSSVVRDRNTFLIEALVDDGERHGRDKEGLLKRDTPGHTKRVRKMLPS